MENEVLSTFQKKGIKLYDFNPAFTVLLFTPIGLVPIIGNLVINLIFSVIVICIVRKRFDVKAIIKTAGVSYLISVAILFSVVILSCAIAYFIFLCAFGSSATYDGKVYPHMIENNVALTFFIAGTIQIFVGNFLLTSRQIFSATKQKIKARVIVSVVLTLLNAPYLLFIPYEQAVYADYNRYHKYVDEKAYEEQKTWVSDDGYLEFKTIERFHRFRPSGDTNDLMRYYYDASDSGKTFAIDFDDWVSDNGGYYNCGGFHAYYLNKGETRANYHLFFSGNYHRTSADELVFELQTVNNDIVKTPYKNGDTIYLHAE